MQHPDEVGAPVYGAMSEGKHANALRLITQSAGNGTYSFRGLRPGKYAILALHPREPEAVAQYDWKLETLELSEGDAIAKDLKLIAGR